VEGKSQQENYSKKIVAEKIEKYGRKTVAEKTGHKKCDRKIAAEKSWQ
jgi:hypothetical protein